MQPRIHQFLPMEWAETAVPIIRDLAIAQGRPKLAVHVAVAPSWLAMGSSPAMTLGNRVLINPSAFQLPDDARRYVMAHEIGHILHGHSKAAFLAFAAIFLSFVISPWLCALVGWGYILVFLVPNGLGDRAEYQADAVAASVLGSPYAVIRAQQEVMLVMLGDLVPQRERRWKRLRALAQAQTEREQRSISHGQGSESGGDGAAGE